MLSQLLSIIISNNTNYNHNTRDDNDNNKYK